MKIVERIKAPIPKFFKILRTIGLVMLAISGTVVAAPVVLPAVMVSFAGYMAVAGGILSAVSQMTVSPMAPEGDRKGGVLRQAQDDTNRARDGD